MAIEKMSAAFEKVQNYRDAMNKGRLKIMAKDLSCVVYFYTNLRGEPCSIGYRGRAKKPSFNYRYQSEAKRAERTNEWILAQSERNEASRKPAPRLLAVDDVLRASWGYDQTNIDYYKITKLIGKSMVEVIEIGQISENNGGMSGDCVPDPSAVLGKPMRRRATGNSVRIDSVRYASKVEPKTIAGCVLYKPDHWTAYH